MLAHVFCLVSTLIAFCSALSASWEAQPFVSSAWKVPEHSLQPELPAPDSSRHGNGAEPSEPSINSKPSAINGTMPGRMNVCDVLCPKWCRRVGGLTNTYSDCHFTCGNICDGKTGNYSLYVGQSHYEVVPITYEFSRYDLDQDKLVSKEELAWTEGIGMDEAVHLFNFADLDGDGFIDEREFHGGPLVFTVQMAAELSSMTLPKNTTTTSPSPSLPIMK